MTIKAETALQLRIQNLIKKRGGYIKKNHGNMITEPGLADLSFAYKGIACYWEIKTPETKNNVSPKQGIHCRLARKAGAITAIIYETTQPSLILDVIDVFYESNLRLKDLRVLLDNLYESEGIDDGTSY